jgi:nicotinamide-nucleotide amidase
VTRLARSIVLTIGDELLLGRTTDSNSAWLADRLAAIGAPVARMETLGDVADQIAGAVRRAQAEASLVVTTGGLGPTADDRTLEAVRMAVGGREVDIEIPNPRGVEPARWYEPSDDAGALLVLPGPPREMTALFEAAVGRIRTSLADGLRSVSARTIATTGIPESRLAPDIQPLVDGIDGVEVAFLPDLHGVDLRLTVRDRTEAEASRLLDAAESAIADTVRPFRVSAPSGDVVEALTDALEARGWTLAVAESCTGGGIGERVTARAGASRSFLGGVVAYSNGAKLSLLGVPGLVLEEHGAVSEPVASAMADGAVRAFGSDCGIGITGIAGPEGGSPEKPVGTVCFAASTPAGGVVTTHRFRGDREAVRRRSAQAALVQLLRLIEEGG